MQYEVRRNPSGELNQERFDLSIHMPEKRSKDYISQKDGGNERKHAEIKPECLQGYKKTRESEYYSGSSQHEATAALSKFNEVALEGFFEIKRKLDEASLQELKKFIPLEEDREKLNKTETKKIVQYLKQIAVFILNSNEELEKELKNGEEEDQEAKNYEALLQKLEADVRQHIRIEQQLKLYVDSTQSKLDEFEYNKEKALQSSRKKLLSCEEEQNALELDLKKKDEELEKLKSELKAREAELKRVTEKKMESSLKQSKLESSCGSSSHSKGNTYTKDLTGENFLNQSFKGGSTLFNGGKLRGEESHHQLKERVNNSNITENIRNEQKRNSNLSSILNGMERSKVKTQSEHVQNSSYSKWDKSYEYEREKEQRDSNLLKSFKRKIEEKKEEVTIERKKEQIFMTLAFKKISQMNASLRYSSKQPQENVEEIAKFKGRNSDISLASRENFYLKGEKESKGSIPENERKEKMLKKARELNKSSVVNRERLERGYERGYEKGAIPKNSSTLNPTKHTYLDTSLAKASPKERKSCYKSTNSEEEKEERETGKKYEKLRATMLSPKLKFEVPRSQSVDIYSKINQRMRRAEADLSLEMGGDSGE